MHLTLYSYIARRFTTSVAFAYAAVLGVFLLVDALEYFRRGEFAHRAFLEILFFMIAKIPFLLQETFFFVIFAATMHTFIQLAKKNEYTAIKASGLSSLQFLAPFLTAALVLYVLMLTIVNPISAHLLAKRDVLRKQQKSISALLENGFWLKNSEDATGQQVIISSKTLQIHGQTVELGDVSFLYLDNAFKNAKTIQCSKAKLSEGYWELEGASEYSVKQAPIQHSMLKINTTITPEDLYNSFINPEHVSIWKMPYFIYTLKATGHSAKIYMLHFSKRVLKPLVLVPMMMLASLLILRPYRMLNLRIVVVGGVVISIVFSIMTEAMYMFGTQMELSIQTITNFFALIIGISSLLLSRIIAKT